MTGFWVPLLLFLVEQVLWIVAVHTWGALAGLAVALLCLPLVRPLQRVAARWADRVLPPGREDALAAALARAVAHPESQRRRAMREAAERALAATRGVP